MEQKIIIIKCQQDCSEQEQQELLRALFDQDHEPEAAEDLESPKQKLLRAIFGSDEDQADPDEQDDSLQEMLKGWVEQEAAKKSRPMLRDLRSELEALCKLNNRLSDQANFVMELSDSEFIPEKACRLFEETAGLLWKARVLGGKVQEYRRPAELCAHITENAKQMLNDLQDRLG